MLSGFIADPHRGALVGLVRGARAETDGDVAGLSILVWKSELPRNTVISWPCDSSVTSLIVLHFGSNGILAAARTGVVSSGVDILRCRRAARQPRPTSVACSTDAVGIGGAVHTDRVCGRMRVTRE